MTDSREDRIRERAHQLWETEGRPDGRGDAHWAQAEQEVDGSPAPATAAGNAAAAEELVAAEAAASPVRKSRKKAPPA